MLSALVCVIRAIKPPRSAIPFSVPVTEGLLESCATLLKNEPSHDEDDVPPAVKSAVFLKTYLDPMTSDSALVITPVDDEDFMPLHACEATRYGAATKESCAEHNALQVCSRVSFLHSSCGARGTDIGLLIHQCKTVAYCGSGSSGSLPDPCGMYILTFPCQQSISGRTGSTTNRRASSRRGEKCRGEGSLEDMPCLFRI